MSDLAAAVRRFVEEEARLLDDQQFDRWLTLFTPDCRYWVPVSPAMTSPADGVSHFHDDIQLMMARCHRLLNPRAFGAEPSPRTAHVVSGVRIDRAADDEIAATSSQIMVEWRDRGQFEADTRVFGGRVTHLLRRDGDSFRIAMKRIDLVNASGPFNAMAAPL